MSVRKVYGLYSKNYSVTVCILSENTKKSLEYLSGPFSFPSLLFSDLFFLLSV